MGSKDSLKQLRWFIYVLRISVYGLFVYVNRKIMKFSRTKNHAYKLPKLLYYNLKKSRKRVFYPQNCLNMASILPKFAIFLYYFVNLLCLNSLYGKFSLVESYDSRILIFGRLMS